MFAALLTLALSQIPAGVESFPQLQDPLSPDLNLASRFIEEHLISFQYNAWTGVELRQGATVYKPGDSLVDAVQLVPQSMPARAAGR